MGFVPNSMRTMAHRPALLKAFAGFAGTVMGAGTVPADLKQLVAFTVSQAAGCRYCQAHTHHGAAHRGVAGDKLADILQFETSPHYTPAERAALRVALHAGEVPNGVTAEHMAELARHFDPGEVVELVAVIGLFGFLNRWNDTLATTLEDAPATHARHALAGAGWVVGKHR